MFFSWQKSKKLVLFLFQAQLADIDKEDCYFRQNATATHLTLLT